MPEFSLPWVSEVGGPLFIYGDPAKEAATRGLVHNNATYSLFHMSLLILKIIALLLLHNAVHGLLTLCAGADIQDVYVRAELALPWEQSLCCSGPSFTVLNEEVAGPAPPGLCSAFCSPARRYVTSCHHVRCHHVL